MHKVLVTGIGAICPLGTTCAEHCKGKAALAPALPTSPAGCPRVLVAQASPARWPIAVALAYLRALALAARMMANAAAAAISMRWGLQGQSNTYSVACASSAVALGEASRAIRHGYLDAAIVVGTEAMLNPGALMAWNALRVMLIETMAQLAGAGLLAGDPHTKTLPEGLVGVLASVRRCVFTHPVRPEDELEFAITCRPIGARAVQVTAQARIKQAEVAQLEIMMLYTERQTLGLA